MKRISVVTVCLGNICRSPLMEALLARAWREHASGLMEIVVTSAGLNPMLDYPTQEAVLTGRELGVDIGEHTSKQIDSSMMATADLVLTATEAMERPLLARFPDRAPGRVFSMGEFAGEPVDIEDPYGRTMARYREVAAQIERYARAAPGLLIARFAEEK
jgi:protein-tyrosine-phosphatase